MVQASAKEEEESSSNARKYNTVFKYLAVLTMLWVEYGQFIFF